MAKKKSSVKGNISAKKPSTGLARRKVAIFLVLAFGLSSIFYYLIANATNASDALIFTTAVMWCPAVAAVLTRLYCQRSLSGFALGIGNAKWQVVGILLPILVGLVMFGSVWLTVGQFNYENAAKVFSFAFLPGFAGALAFNLFAAFGEELGWRGLLVPEMSKFMGFTKMAVLTGAIWTAWHLPFILFGSYHGSGELWFSLAVFIPSVICSGIVLAWLRLKSGSVWTAVLFHGIWNYFIQHIYPMLTVQTPATEMITGEFGWASPVIYLVLALVAWNYRGLLPKSAFRT